MNTNAPLATLNSHIVFAKLFNTDTYMWFHSNGLGMDLVFDQFIGLCCKLILGLELNEHDITLRNQLKGPSTNHYPLDCDLEELLGPINPVTSSATAVPSSVSGSPIHLSDFATGFNFEPPVAAPTIEPAQPSLPSAIPSSQPPQLDIPVQPATQVPAQPVVSTSQSVQPTTQRPVQQLVSDPNVYAQFTTPLQGELYDFILEHCELGDSLLSIASVKTLEDRFRATNNVYSTSNKAMDKQFKGRTFRGTLEGIFKAAPALRNLRIRQGKRSFDLKDQTDVERFVKPEFVNECTNVLNQFGKVTVESSSNLIFGLVFKTGHSVDCMPTGNQSASSASLQGAPITPNRSTKRAASQVMDNSAAPSSQRQRVEVSGLRLPGYDQRNEELHGVHNGDVAEGSDTDSDGGF
ncbi:hypothetical protein GGF32_006364 [Allomyces javanicus]|nr:hypothetical protein GGF32_006364 [Allomyces javanicus]